MTLFYVILINTRAGPHPAIDVHCVRILCEFRDNAIRKVRNNANVEKFGGNQRNLF
jgi:hypothetical protein